MSSEPRPATFLQALPEGFLEPEQTPVIFHLMGPQQLPVIMQHEGESEPHRARRWVAEPAPKPTSRCFPR
jgi:hypothetical protein